MILIRFSTLFIYTLLIGACATPVMEVSQNSNTTNTQSNIELFIVPIGNQTPRYLDKLANDIVSQFSLNVKSTSKLAIKGHTYDSNRDQLIAQELIRLLRNYADYAPNSHNAIFVGITPFDIYDRSKKAAYVLFFNDKQRFAIISSARLGDDGLGGSKDEINNLHKLIARNIDKLLYKLPLKENPNSVLYKYIYTYNDLQKVTEHSILTDIIVARKQKKTTTIEADIAKLNVAAKNGDAMAQNNLAWAYQNGLGVQQNLELAYQWYLKAAKSDFTRAQNKLAYLYLEGLGVEQNSGEALKWFQQAAQAGLPTVYLADMYFEGNGTTQNLKEAAHWYSILAEKGDATAQYRLGNMHYRGIAMLVNSQKAISLYTQAAKQGLDSAQFALGIAYLSGQGTAKDTDSAKKWFEKAGQQGHRKAQLRLGRLYLSSDEQQAEKWLY